MNLDLYPCVGGDDLGWLSEQQMIEIDRVMIEDLHITLIQMMENAGRNLARLVLDGCSPTSAVVYAGSGGNGGGGLVAARHLANAGVDVSVTLSRPAEEVGGVPAHQLDIVRRMGIPLATPDRVDVAVDALIGYSLRGAPRGRTAELLEQASTRADSVVSLDAPSGLNVTTGEAPGAVVSADATLTLALPKLGLRHRDEVGALYLADISVPPQVARRIGAKPPGFADSSILRVDR